MHDDPAVAELVASLPVQESDLDWILDQLSYEEQGRMLGDVSMVNTSAGWGACIERRAGMPEKANEVFEKWARSHVARFLVTRDPTVDGWFHYTEDEDGDPIDAWHLVCLGTNDMPDLSFLEGLEL